MPEATLPRRIRARSLAAIVTRATLFALIVYAIAGAVPASASAPDIRQAGNVAIAGGSDIRAGGRVYLAIPVINVGSAASPRIHAYGEGVVPSGAVWRPDGAQPSAASIAPGQTVTFTVQHDLWADQIGTWRLTGAFLWNNDANGYYGPLNTNGYSQSVTFDVRPAAAPADIRQAGNVEIAAGSDIRPGGKVYLTIPVRNAGGTTSGPIQAYGEGLTGTGNVWRPSDAPAVSIAPGQTVVFRVSHDLWADNVGTWRLSGAFLWNTRANSYVGPLNPDGYSQAVSFTVQPAAAPVDLRQAGNVEIAAGSDIRLGGKVYLTIPVKNVGGTTSDPVQAYGEGITGTGNVWRPSDAPAVSIAPGETVVFKVSHDIWADNAGTWRLNGAYLWNARVNSYVGPLNANGYSQSVSFTVQPAAAPVDLRQAGNVEIAAGSDVRLGGKVYLTIPVKNVGGTTSDPVQAYGEGITGTGNVWRPSDAPAVPIAPGQTVVFKVSHDIWADNPGTWRLTGTFLWNARVNSYVGPLNANGYSQSVSFTVQPAAAPVDLRQAGNVEIAPESDIRPGGKVYLTIPVKNVGGTRSDPLQAYAEGTTGTGILWRPSGAASAQIGPGETVTFTVSHDLWADNLGTWRTTGIFLWNASVNSYIGPINSDGYSGEVAFLVSASDAPTSVGLVPPAYAEARAPASLVIKSATLSIISQSDHETRLRARVVVVNLGGSPARTGGALPGSEQSEADQATNLPAGTWRVGIEYDDHIAVERGAELDHRWRWGFGADVAPHGEGFSYGDLVLRTPGTHVYYIGLVKEGEAWVVWRFEPSLTPASVGIRPSFPWASGATHTWTGGPHGSVKGRPCLQCPVSVIGTADRSGMDFGGGGWDVHSVAPGRVVFSGFLDGGFGFGVVVDHGSYQSVYAHMSSSGLIKPRTLVGRSNVLGTTSCTGTGCAQTDNPANPIAHLHVDLRRGGESAGAYWSFGDPIGWDGQTIGGWSITAASTNYDGWATRGRIVLTADANAPPRFSAED